MILNISYMFLKDIVSDTRFSTSFSNGRSPFSPSITKSYWHSSVLHAAKAVPAWCARVINYNNLHFMIGSTVRTMRPVYLISHTHDKRNSIRLKSHAQKERYDCTIDQEKISSRLYAILEI